MWHIALHFVVPLIIARRFFPMRWRFAFMIMVATMLVDVDHLLADPIYDPHRCSIGFHPLHGYLPIAAYVVLTGFAQTRLVGIGLVIHMALDALDCVVP